MRTDDESTINPPSAPEIATKRRDLAPNQHAAFDALDKAIFVSNGDRNNLLSLRRQSPIGVTQSPGCIEGHTKAALRSGATPQELMEAIWVAALMRAGGAYGHSRLMLATLSEEQKGVG